MWDRLAHRLNSGALRPAAGYALIVAAIVATTALLTCAGCGAGAISTHARAVLTVSQVHRVAGESIDTARAAALDRVEAEHPDHGAARDAALDAEADHWRPAGQVLDAVAETLRAWVAALDLAAAAGGDSWLGEALALGMRVIALWSQAVSIAGSLDVELPALPSLSSLLGGS